MLEQQDGTQMDSTGVPVVWNRAEGDPNIKAKTSVEPEDYNLRYGGNDDIVGNATNPNNYPVWAPAEGDGQARWKGKGGVFFDGDPNVGESPTLGAEFFKGAESAKGDRIIRNVTFSFWTYITRFDNWTQRIHFWGGSSGEAGTYLFHTSTGNVAVFRTENAGTQMATAALLEEFLATSPQLDTELLALVDAYAKAERKREAQFKAALVEDRSDLVGDEIEIAQNCGQAGLMLQSEASFRHAPA